MNDTPAIPAIPASSETAATNAPTSDEHLMLAFSKGSADAFDDLFHRYKQPIYGFFRRRVSDPSHAEELSQETFFALLRAARRYQPRALFRTYLYAIAFKILRAHRRKSAFRAAFFLQKDKLPDPAAHDATESSLWVRRAVEKLDAIDREILLLREFEQLSYAEISDLLDLPLNTVRSRLFRARTALRDLLDPVTASASLNATNSSSVTPLTTALAASQNTAPKGERS
jgi:RNA polymerase sigma-70 factor (ECF subfamily)